MNIHSSAFSEVTYDPALRLLTMVWKKESNQLDESGVKSEFARVLRYIKEYGIRNVIVDSRDYTFRTNVPLQTWMTRSYIPEVMETSIKRYAIIVDPGLIKELKNPDPEEPGVPRVDYFTSLSEAQQWVSA